MVTYFLNDDDWGKLRQRVPAPEIFRSELKMAFITTKADGIMGFGGELRHPFVECIIQETATDLPDFVEMIFSYNTNLPGMIYSNWKEIATNDELWAIDSYRDKPLGAYKGLSVPFDDIATAMQPTVTESLIEATRGLAILMEDLSADDISFIVLLRYAGVPYLDALDLINADKKTVIRHLAAGNNAARVNEIMTNDIDGTLIDSLRPMA